MPAVTLAKKTGFCFGVKRAVDMALEVLEKEKAAYSLGSIIHNRQVVEDLAGKGLAVVERIEDVPQGGTVVISSHGSGPQIARRLAKQGMKVVDTTCPFVLNAQRIAKSLHKEGYAVIIVGDKDHPEVRALVDFAGEKTYVVKDTKEAAALRLSPNEKLSIVSQTTQSTERFLDVVREILKKGPKEMRIFNTICRDAQERQVAARALASKVKVMLVVGGKNSANTRRLYDVCRKVSPFTYLIETEKELDRKRVSGKARIGITSGASTPQWVIEKVVKKIQKK